MVMRISKRIRKFSSIVFLLVLSLHFICWKTQPRNVEKRCIREASMKTEARSIFTTKTKFSTSQNIIENIREEDTLYLIKRQKLEYLNVPNFDLSRCWQSECLQNRDMKWRMFTFVKSSCDNQLLRYSIRRTWGSMRHFLGGNFHTIFVIGEAKDEHQQELIAKEQDKYNDILQINIPDNYSNLVFKSLAGMQWVSENVPDEDFYSVVDDDMFVNLIWVQRYLLEVMTTLDQLPTVPIFCMFGIRTSLPPVRDEGSKYYCTEEEYRWPFWPDFCLGGMYTTSVEVARRLWIHSRTEPIVHLEDAWITGILRQKLGMPKEMLVVVKPAAALHLASTSNLKQTLVSAFMFNLWRKVQANIPMENDLCICF